MRVKGKGECSIVNVAEIKPFTAALRPVPDADSGTEKALLQRLPKLPMDHEFAPSDSGLCKDMTGFLAQTNLNKLRHREEAARIHGKRLPVPVPARAFALRQAP